jgi:hypothetical protein
MHDMLESSSKAKQKSNVSKIHDKSSRVDEHQTSLISVDIKSSVGS